MNPTSRIYNVINNLWSGGFAFAPQELEMSYQLRSRVADDQESEDDSGSSFVPDDEDISCVYNGRFGALQSDVQMELARGETEETAQSVIRRNSWAMNLYESWVTSRNSRVDDEDFTDNKYARIIKPLHEMSDEELNYWLSKFFCEVRTHDGREYNPKTLTCVCMGLQSHLKDMTKRPIQLLGDPTYSAFQRSYHAEFHRLSKKGCSQTASAKKAFCQKNEEVMWSQGILGSDTPQVLLQTLVYLNGKHFGLKGGKEHRSLTRSDVTFVTINGVEHIRYFWNTSPPGTTPKRIPTKEVFVPPNLKMPERCHVRLCQLYFSKWTSFSDEYFYVSPMKLVPKHSATWYNGTYPVGHNTISKIISDMSKQARTLSSELGQVLEGVPFTGIDSNLCGVTPWEVNAEPTSTCEEPVAKRLRTAMDHSIIINGTASLAVPEVTESSNGADIGVQCNLFNGGNGAAPIYYINNCNVTINNGWPPERST